MSRNRDIVLVEPARKRIQRVALDVKFHLLSMLSRFYLVGANAPDFASLKVMCLFVGHGRSGGSIVGALLNAHRNIVMSNELNALRRLRLGLNEQQMYRLIYVISRRQAGRGSKGGGGYSYRVEDQWQGRHQNLIVIGDRKAGATSYEIISDLASMEILDRKVSLRKRFIHVVRNPFNAIATTFLKTLSTRDEDPSAHLRREVRNFFVRCTAVCSVQSRFGVDAVHFVHHESLIENPAEQLAQICEFLGVEAYPDYLTDCAAIVSKNPHETWQAIEWPPDLLELVPAEMRRFPWLHRYSTGA